MERDLDHRMSEFLGKSTEGLIAEVHRLRAALEDVRNPMRVLQRHADANDAKLNGMAYSIANNLAFVQDIARKALER